MPNVLWKSALRNALVRMLIKTALSGRIRFVIRPPYRAKLSQIDTSSCPMSRDNLFALPHDRVGDFTFDKAVVDVFPDMIARSVPGYASILAMIQQLASRYIQPTSNVYDLGCSLGAATLLMREKAPRDATIHAVDSSPAMIAGLKDVLSQNTDGCQVLVHEADMRGFPMLDSSFTVLNLTLQFIAAEQRHSLLGDVYRSLLPGGALLLSEKICFDDPSEQDLLTELHHDFKSANGYSQLEIAQKRTSLENRLIPETLSAHIDRLHDVGFETAVPWFQCFNFVSILAVKSKS